MLKLVVCIIILAAVCCAQEHLTCLRTDDVLNQQNPQTPQRAVQGPPGKRGAKGQVGSRGRRGQKGEPGIPDNQQINLLWSQYDSLFEEVEALKLKSKENQQFLDVFAKRLYVPPHYYIYQLTPDRQSWQESQEVCQNWGSTLAMHGVKTFENRKKLIQNISINKTHFWIGANDIASEGNRVWMNGESASYLNWRFGLSHGDSDCVVVSAYRTFTFGEIGDASCTYLLQGLCEKQM